MKHTTAGVTNEWKIYCGREQIGVITEWDNIGFDASCLFKINCTREVDSLKEGVKYIEQELETYISNIIKVDI